MAGEAGMHSRMTRDGLLLAIDTATRASVVALGDPGLVSQSVRQVRHRHGSNLLEQIDEALEQAAAGIDDVISLAVGTGPGSFTGLRVGLATAKTIAYARDLPLLGVPSADALRRAAVESVGAPPGIAVVLPAGAHDHYLVRDGQAPVLVAPGGLAEALADVAVMSIDLDSALLGDAAARLGEAAVAGLPAALLALAAERLQAGERDEPAELVPAYVALPRGVQQAAEELGWSPDLR
jgi:tRNA threonylcarbamoyladenosine biosynthesis protein TsaB